MHDTQRNNGLASQEAFKQPAPRLAAKTGIETLTVGAEDLAGMLGISKATLHRWDAGGLLGPAGRKIGGRRLWVMAEVREWVDTGMPERAAWMLRKRSK